MCPCNPDSIAINIPAGPSTPNIPGFGRSFSVGTKRTEVIKAKKTDQIELSQQATKVNSIYLLNDKNEEIKDINYLNPDGYILKDRVTVILGTQLPAPDTKVKVTYELANIIKLEGFPPDLEKFYEFINGLFPSGKIKATVNPNIAKDILDYIIKIFDYVAPFLMLYKMLLPILNLIMCMIELFCALPNPIAFARAMVRFFRDCLPPFLNLFPIFALIILIISILLLLLQIIVYIVALVLKLIQLIKKQIKMLKKAIELADATSILMIARKLGLIICLFKQIFLALLVVSMLIGIIKDILSLSFNLKPCAKENEDCCGADVCPEFIRNGNIDRNSGKFQYLSKIVYVPDPLFPTFTQISRNESYQFYDLDATIYQKFINMVDAQDPSLEGKPKPLFYPSDGSYTKDSVPNTAPYTIDIKFEYDPATFGRTGSKQYVWFKDCIVTGPTSGSLFKYDNSTTPVDSGVLFIAGGKGYDQTGNNAIKGYDPTTGQQTNSQATLETFIHLNTITSQALIDNTIVFNPVEYIFKINHQVLMSKALINSGCLPEISDASLFANQILSNDLAVKQARLSAIKLPDIDNAINCMNASLDAFTVDVTDQGADNLETSLNACLANLQAETEDALAKIIPVGFDKYKSGLTLTPRAQFTTLPIQVSVDLRENNGNQLAPNLPDAVAVTVAEKIVADITLGTISTFTYDGSGLFIANITSDSPGSGEIQVAFEGDSISDLTLPADLTQPPTTKVRKIPYQFIYAPSVFTTVAVGDPSDGSSRREGSDANGSTS